MSTISVLLPAEGSGKALSAASGEGPAQSRDDRDFIGIFIQEFSGLQSFSDSGSRKGAAPLPMLAGEGEDAPVAWEGASSGEPVTLPPGGNELPPDDLPLPPGLVLAAAQAARVPFRGEAAEPAADALGGAVVKVGAEVGVKVDMEAAEASAAADGDPSGSPVPAAAGAAETVPALTAAHTARGPVSPGKPQASIIQDPRASRSGGIDTAPPAQPLREDERLAEASRPLPLKHMETAPGPQPRTPLLAEVSPAGADDALEPPRPEASTVVRPRETAAESAFATQLSRAEAAAAVAVPVGRSGWAEAVGQRMLWLGSQGVGQAELALNPPELGPLQVRIHTQNEQASVVFSSAHAGVRDALDQALPRLREMFEGQGLQLVDVDVRDQPRQGRQSQLAHQGAAGRGRETYGDDAPLQDDAAPRRSLGLVDDYI